MNAKTVLNDHTKLKLLQRLEALHHSAQDLIYRDTRSEEEADVLLDALQAFKQGQLRGVVRPVVDGTMQEVVLKAFSMTVEDTPFTEETKKYLLQRGVRYIGEMFYAVFDARSPKSRNTGKAIFNELRGIYGLKRQMDPLVLGWKPPYWNEYFLSLLNRPVLDVFGSYDADFVDQRNERGRHQNHPAWASFARRLHGRGVHFLGQFLKEERIAPSSIETSTWTSGKLLLRQRNFAVVNASIWAAALIPPDWSPPQEVPQCWLEEQKKIEQEQAEWQAQREREHQEQAAAEPPRLTDEEALEANLLRSVEELELSVRSASVLEAMGIRYVGQLIGHTEGELLRMRAGSMYIGRKSLKEIKEILGVMGLSLGMVLPPEIKAKLDALVAPEHAPSTEEVLDGDAHLQAMLESDLDELGLPVPMAQFFKKNGLRYVGQLVARYTEDSLLRAGKMVFGRKSVRELMARLNSMGLQLGMKIPSHMEAALKDLAASDQSSDTSAP